MPLAFHKRTEEEEIMDDFDLGGPVLYQTLDQLGRVHQWLGGKHTLAGLKQILASLPAQSSPISIADVGCGGGDTLRQLAAWGRKKGISMELVGFDANEHAIMYAREHSQAWPEIRYEAMDCCSDSFFAQQFDVLTCNLMLHHFPDEQLRKHLPQWLQMANKGLIVNDLQRHWLPWVAFALVTWILRASHMIRHDGLLSIRRGFTRRELKHLLQSSTQFPISLQWRWAFRYLAVVHTDTSHT